VADSKASELVSIQGFKVKDLCVLDTISSPVIGKAPVDRPLIGIISGEDTTQCPRNRLLLYSLRSATFQAVELGMPAIGICANSTSVVVVGYSLLIWTKSADLQRICATVGSDYV
jgi:hypothetical protein